MLPGLTAVDVGSKQDNQVCLMDSMNPFHLFTKLVGHYDGIVVLEVSTRDFHLSLESHASNSK